MTKKHGLNLLYYGQLYHNRFYLEDFKFEILSH